MPHLDMTMGARIASVFLLFLVLVVGLGNLWSTYTQVGNLRDQLHRQQVQQQEAQKAASQATEKKLCDTFASIASLKPPSSGSNPGANPSRVYEQKLHDKLVAVGADIGCPGTK